MTLDHPVITDLFFHDTVFRTSASVKARPFSSLTLRKSGKVLISATNGEFISGPNTLTFVPAGCAYDTQILEEGEMYLLHFWLLDDGKNFYRHPICVTPPSTTAFVSLFERALRHSRAPQDPYAILADAYRLLSEARPLFLEDSQAPNAKMIACKQFLDEHLCDPDLRIAHLAERYGCSEVYFRREFRKCYHASPLEYLKKRRMEMACRLLETRLYSVAEVATRAGFDSISYFSAEFRRMMGVSPREYRDGE
ncbi:MAG: helix-turn-helix transcriptional regulator [Clostridia bacterium]|nr:helix-turn-helix transcriptional regulator [Clostridia bacterium]